MDATEKIVGAIVSSKWEIEVLLSRSVPVAGFNLIDPEEILKTTGVPSVFVLEEEPDSVAVERALRKHFPDWRRRLEVLSRPLGPQRFEIPGTGGSSWRATGSAPSWHSEP